MVTDTKDTVEEYRCWNPVHAEEEKVWTWRSIVDKTGSPICGKCGAVMTYCGTWSEQDRDIVKITERAKARKQRELKPKVKA